MWLRSFLCREGAMISLSLAAEKDGDGTLDQAKRRNIILAHQ